MRSIGSELFFWLRFYPQILYPSPDLDNLRILSAKHPPLLVLHGLKDKLIRPAHAIDLFSGASAPKKLVILPRAGHCDLPACDPKSYCKGVKDFITTLP